MADFLPLIIQMLVIFLIFYFIIIRPQNKKRENFKKKLDGIQKGDKVITSGGLKGTVKDFQGKNSEIVILDVGSDTRVNCVRNYIVSVEGK
tara:strand:- start:849 stop:1121 length:273 start_codon:yes stop_codon:yes gene_type:complete